MNTRLKASLENAERRLPADALDRLAMMVDAVAMTYGRQGAAMFSDAELAEIRAMEDEPDEAADPAAVAALFARHGL